MEEKKISENLSYWRVAPPVRTIFFSFTFAYFEHRVISFPRFALCFFWQLCSLGSWSIGLGLDRNFV